METVILPAIFFVKVMSPVKRNPPSGSRIKTYDVWGIYPKGTLQKVARVRDKTLEQSMEPVTSPLVAPSLFFEGILLPEICQMDLFMYRFHEQVLG